MEKTIHLHSNEEAIAIYGSLDENLRYAEKEFGVRVSARNNRLKIIGDKEGTEKAHRFFLKRLEEFRKERHVRSGKHGGADPRLPAGQAGVRASLMGSDPFKTRTHAPKSSGLSFFHHGKVISPKTKNQEKYIEAIRSKDIVFGIGPAGTGKTYLAMAAALDYLKKKLVARIVLTRPAVEAGESLGFLPGDFQAKVNPYLRPLYDALYDMMDFEEAVRYVERGVIEVAPIAYMRGRTLNDSFVILDEAQNCTHAQMKMFLTRLGQNSRAVITGDITQIDLPGGKRSGLVEAQDVLANIRDLQFVIFDDTDVVRHRLVAEIVNAYERYERRNTNK